MPNKPARYGIKLWVACDAKSSYAWKMSVYAGRRGRGGTPPPTAEGDEGPLSARVVVELTRGLGSGRAVTCDNFFASHGLACRLFRERGLSMLGTLRANRPEIPSPLLEARGREVKSSLFAFAEATAVSPRAVAVSYLAKKNKNVLLLSTVAAHATRPAVSDLPHRKPLVVLDYNRTKGGVDNLDKLLATYSCRRKTARWPLALFHNIVDVSAYNAFVLWRELNPLWMRGKRHMRRVFLRCLGEALVHAVALAQKSGLPRGPSRPRARKRSPSPSPQRPPSAKRRRRCEACPRSADRKTSSRCASCLKYVCGACSRVLCPEC